MFSLPMLVAGSSGTGTVCPQQPAVLCRAAGRAGGALLRSLLPRCGPQALLGSAHSCVCSGSASVPWARRGVSQRLLTLRLLCGCR